MNEMLVPILLSLLLGVSLALLVWSLFRYPAPAEPPLHRRFAVAVGVDKRDTLFEQPLLAPIMNVAQSCARRINVGGLRQKVRRDLEASGNPNNYSVDEYLSLCLVSALGLALASAAVFIVFSGTIQPVALLFMAAIGFVAPILTLSSAAKARIMRIPSRISTERSDSSSLARTDAAPRRRAGREKPRTSRVTAAIQAAISSVRRHEIKSRSVVNTSTMQTRTIAVNSTERASPVRPISLSMVLSSLP